MKKNLFIAFILSFVFSFASPNDPDINMNNKVLIKLHSKSISMLDVKKKMDFIFHKMYPNMEDSTGAKYQFYASSWQNTLRDMINAELLLIEAESKQMQVADGEIREELENRFGPNVTLKLSEIGLTFNEAFEMIKKEMIVQRMTWLFVYSKAHSQITPGKIKAEYRDYLEKNPPYDFFNYHVISIKSKDEKISEEIANKIFLTVKAEKNKDLTLDELKEEIKNFEKEAVAITISPEYNLSAKEMSKVHKNALINLSSTERFSSPIKQNSRYSKDLIIHRIFHLKKHDIISPSTFDDMAFDIKENLLQKAAEKEAGEYFNKLYTHYGINIENVLNVDFQPFSIQ